MFDNFEYNKVGELEDGLCEPIFSGEDVSGYKNVLFTVYGHLPKGGVCALVDTPDEQHAIELTTFFNDLLCKSAELNTLKITDEDTAGGLHPISLLLSGEQVGNLKSLTENSGENKNNWPAMTQGLLNGAILKELDDHCSLCGTELEGAVTGETAICPNCNHGITYDIDNIALEHFEKTGCCVSCGENDIHDETTDTGRCFERIVSCNKCDFVIYEGTA